MGNFDALARPREYHGVVTHDIATTHGGKPNGGSRPFARIAFTSVNRNLGEVSAKRMGDYFAHAQRRAGRRIDFMTVMCLDDFDIVPLAEDRGSQLEQL